MRDIQPDDIRAAIDGIGMRRMSLEELLTLHDRHKDEPLFSSKVIVKAAQMVIDSIQFRGY